MEEQKIEKSNFCDISELLNKSWCHPFSEQPVMRDKPWLCWQSHFKLFSIICSWKHFDTWLSPVCVSSSCSPLFSICAMTLYRWHLLLIFSCLNILSLISLSYKFYKSYSVKSSLSSNLGLSLWSYDILFFPNNICYLCIFCFSLQISQGSQSMIWRYLPWCFQSSNIMDVCDSVLVDNHYL